VATFTIAKVTELGGLSCGVYFKAKF